MKVNRGDVVLLDHPFSDATGSKVRPALVVQSDARNALLAETVVALITKNLKYVGKDTTQLLIDLGTPEGKASGLKVNSAVKCGKLYTVHEDNIRKKIGVLPATLMTQINDCLKAALELPEAPRRTRGASDGERPGASLSGCFPGPCRQVQEGMQESHGPAQSSVGEARPRECAAAALLQGLVLVSEQRVHNLPEFDDYLQRLRETDPQLAADFGGFTGIEQVLQWMARRDPATTAVDIVAQDEFEYDFLVRLDAAGRWLAFGVT
jgi:mRNA interferase MazF